MVSQSAEQRCLAYILKVNIESSFDIQTVICSYLSTIIKWFPATTGYFLVKRLSIFTGKLFVETIFKTRTAIVLIDETYGAVS